MNIEEIQKAAEAEFSAMEATISKLRERQASLKRQMTTAANQAKRLEQELSSGRSFTADYVSRLQREQEKTVRRFSELESEMAAEDSSGFGDEEGQVRRDDGSSEVAA